MEKPNNLSKREDEKEHTDPVRNLPMKHRAQGERPIGLSAGKILAWKGDKPKGASNILRTTKMTDDDRKGHRETGVGDHSRTRKRGDNHEATEEKEPADSVPKLQMKSTAQAERPIGVSAGKILAWRREEPKGASNNLRTTKMTDDERGGQG